MADPSPLLKYRWKILAALIAAVLLLILFVRWWRGPEVLFDKVVRREGKSAAKKIGNFGQRSSESFHDRGHVGQCERLIWVHLVQLLRQIQRQR